MKKAIDDKKLIVIMRARTRWGSIKEVNLGERLKKYDNKIILNNSRRVYLTQNNMGKENWNKFLEELHKPIIVE